MPRRGENIYKRKDGRWEGRYNYTNENGKRHYCSVYARTYQDIKEKLSRLKAYEPKECSSCKLTVTELFSQWMSAVRFKVKETTFLCYRMKAVKHIIPRFGRMRYTELKVNDLHEFINSKVRSGLSVKYVSDIIIVFKSMSKYISKTYNCADPIKNVILPRKDKKQTELYSEEQQGRLKNTAFKDDKRTRLAVMLSFYTGLRIGEVCGLKWEDIDFKTNTLTVNKTVQRIYNGISTKVIIGSPKSKSSVRTIPMPKAICDMLRQSKMKGDAYVLSGNEKALEPRTLQYRFKAFLKKS